MGSKLVVNRQKSSETVRSAGTGYESKIVERIGAMLGAEAGAAAGTLTRAAVADLTTRVNAMVTADDVHLNEISDDGQAIANRDERTAAVRAVLIDLREVCTTVYGPEFARRLGFDGATPSDGVQLHRLGLQVVENLAKGAPESTRFGLTVDLNQFRDHLLQEVDHLSSAIAAVSEDARRADMKLVQKRDTMAAYDASFMTTANLVSTLLKLAGEDELARRVRPSSRRPGQTMEDASDDASLPETTAEQTQVDVA